MNTITKAKPYRRGILHPTSTAQNVLIRQFNFPEHFSKEDGHISRKVSDIYHLDKFRAERCFEQHLVAAPRRMSIVDHLQELPDEKVLDFVKNFLQIDRLPPMKIEWNGYRITASVNQSNGKTEFEFELFAKHPESDTEVYTGSDAPNVKRIANHEQH